MFMLFGGRGRTGILLRVAMLAIVLIAVFAFHAHGTTLLIVRVALIAIVVGAIFAMRRVRPRDRDDDRRV